MDHLSIKQFFLILLLSCWIFDGLSQSRVLTPIRQGYTRQDSLRGSITPERSWWDLLHNDLKVEVDISERSINGSNTITYRVLESQDLLQIDLQPPMKIDKVTQEGLDLQVVREGNAHFVKLMKEQTKGKENTLTIYFSGKPRTAVRAPWDGGFSWSEDENGAPFVATSNQGLGASVWWPCKDHPYDEPDNGQILSITVPKDLVAVGNGRLVKTKKTKDKKTFVWEVVNPINNYGVNVNIGKYTKIPSTYDGLKGELDVDFWVLEQNEKRAREHFKDAYRTLEALEHWFGPYPFYEDSYKLVEVPYLGMEHQSSVTYGNKFTKGYLGTDLSDTGWGLKWDFIIIHESGHEWFANNITYRDAADMWIHEGFTSYSESLFTEYFYGKEAGAAYSRGLRKRIQNQAQVIGDYDVNKEGSGDMYYKGHNMLHTIRQIIGDDEIWRTILVGLNRDFYHQTVSTTQVENYISRASNIDFTKVFDQYLRDIRIPVLEYFIKNQRIHYRWTGVVDGFDMPIDVLLQDTKVRLYPETAWKQIDGDALKIDDNYYIYSQEMK